MGRESKKRVLITGGNSYIGNALQLWLQAETISVRDDKWKSKDFSVYDAVINVAGIAHVEAKADMESLYYKINRDLAVDIARKAREAGVKQYIFMSSIIVYGERNSLKTPQVITKNTKPQPNNFYGNSKLQAEEGIKELQTESFQTAILRLPMVYGKGSKGNYRRLAAMAKRLPIFPLIKNRRSMLHIDNLCEFVRILLLKGQGGTFFPQNEEYVCTSDLVAQIAKIKGNRYTTISLFNPIIFLLGKKINVINKLFGTLVYEKEISQYEGYYYQIRDFENSVRLTEE